MTLITGNRFPQTSIHYSSRGTSSTPARPTFGSANPVCPQVCYPSKVQSAIPPNTMMNATLDNGTTGYFMQKPGARKSSFQLTIPTRVLPPGVDDLLAFSILQGSMTTKRQLEDWHRQGLSIEAGKDARNLSIWAEIPAGQEMMMAKAVMNLLTQPLVDPAMFNTQKTKLIQTNQQNAADPDDLLETAMARRIFGPDHPFSRNTQQKIADLSGQTLSSVMAYHPTLLQLIGQGRAMMISPLPIENQRQTLMSAFYNVNAMPSPVSTNLRSPVDRPVLTGHWNVLLPNESVERALVKASWQVPDPRDPDYPTFLLLRGLMLGTGKYSFFKSLRTDDGLVYAIPLADPLQLPQGRTFTPSVKVEFSKLGRAIEDMRNVTQRLCDPSKPIDPIELDAIKREQLLNLRRACETSDATGEFYSPWLSYPDATPPNLQDLQTALNRVTSQDIQRVAQRIFGNPNSLRLMGVSAPTQVLQQWFPGQPLEKNLA